MCLNIKILKKHKETDAIETDISFWQIIVCKQRDLRKKEIKIKLKNRDWQWDQVIEKKFWSLKFQSLFNKVEAECIIIGMLKKKMYNNHHTFCKKKKKKIKRE